ncbi:hypothetical protein GGX14DRAFT_386205 [Mycena pura]|uniref:Uncharacterized protein n=1 Tax=Mycena pura TaxID=153505 RepID=A0AAD7E2N5_9AGAR|nr:hypothetical protein GGX14DRAFT_386205 [Mycena pura]
MSKKAQICNSNIQLVDKVLGFVASNIQFWDKEITKSQPQISKISDNPLVELHGASAELLESFTVLERSEYEVVRARFVEGPADSSSEFGRPPAYPNRGPIQDPETHFPVSVGQRSHLTSILGVGNILFRHRAYFGATKVTKIFTWQPSLTSHDADLAGLAGLRRDANLHDLSFAQLSTTFTRLLSLLKNDILLCQPHNISTDAPPSFLLPTVRLVASGAPGVPADAVPKLWDALKDDVWHFATRSSPRWSADGGESVSRTWVETRAHAHDRVHGQPSLVRTPGTNDHMRGSDAHPFLVHLAPRTPGPATSAGCGGSACRGVAASAQYHRPHPTPSRVRPLHAHAHKHPLCTHRQAQAAAHGGVWSPPRACTRETPSSCAALAGPPAAGPRALQRRRPPHDRPRGALVEPGAVQVCASALRLHLGLRVTHAPVYALAAPALGVHLCVGVGVARSRSRSRSPSVRTPVDGLLSWGS